MPLRCWHAELPPDVLAALGLPAGEPGHMTAYELLALFFSLVIWRRWLGNKAVAATAQLDNSSALKITAKLTSKEAICNRIAAEIALQVAWAQIHTFEHYRNTLNVEADALSRIGKGKEGAKETQAGPQGSFPGGTLQSIAMKDWPRTEGLKKEKKERRKRQKEAGGQELGPEMDGCTLAAASLDSLPLADLLLAAWLEAPFREPPMLFVALWLWLDKPWLCALFEALAEEEASPGRRTSPRSRHSSLCPPPLQKRGRRQKKVKEKGAEDAGRAQGETAAAEAPGRAAGTEDSSHVSGRAPSVSGPEPHSLPESGPTARLCHPPCRQTPGLPIVGPEARGRVVVEAPDWLETRGHGK